MQPTDELFHLEDLTRRFRVKLVEMSHKAKAPHLGSCLSCVDILAAAYWRVLDVNPEKPDDPDRDRFILSKGHAAPALYVALAFRGFFEEARLDRYAQPGSGLTEHPSLRSVPGVEATTGSLGHGLGMGLGMAVVGKTLGKDFRVVVCLSDGECDEGSVWEAALLAPAHGLERLAVVVDFNKWQATGRSREIMALDPLLEKWSSFGWSAREVDGHDLGQLSEALSRVPDGSGKPVAVIAHTVKGKGVSFMEDDNNWHYRIPTGDEVKRAREELLP